MGNRLLDLGYCPSQLEVSPGKSTRLGFWLDAMRVVYPAFYCLKEWIKRSTPMGRLVNMYRLHLDEPEDAIKDDTIKIEEGLPAGGAIRLV